MRSPALPFFLLLWTQACSSTLARLGPLDAAKAGILEWNDANWTDDGSAQIPLGNGDVTAGIWVANDTGGDVRILIDSSSAMDENSQPVKIGVLRLKLDPPPLDQNHSFLLQRFDPTTASFTIRDRYTILAYVDAHDPLLRIIIRANHTFSATATLEPYRRHEHSLLGFQQADCHPQLRFDHYDTVVNTSQLSSPLNDTVTWYHQNPDNASTAFFDETLQRQGLDPQQFPNPFKGRIFGGSLYSPHLHPPLHSDGLTLWGTNLTSADISIAVFTQRPSTAEAWLESMANLIVSTDQPPELAWKNHKSAWDQLWNRSFVHLSPRNPAADSTLTDRINAHLIWDRYLALIQGRNSASPIKFNGQAFTANLTGKGWDWRFWGSGYWWQNTRQPYYNSLMQGDVDVLDAMIHFYQTMLPVGRARTARQFQGIDPPLPPDAVFFPETTTGFGTFFMADWDGCTGNASRPHGAGNSPWIRYHFSGGLELALLVLDRHQWTRNATVLIRQLPLVLGVVSAFLHRFPIPSDGGPVDLFPTQSLETWQCHDPANRADCVTNPTPDIAGLRAVLTRLVDLPPDVVSDYQRSLWTNYTRALPPIPTQVTADNQTVVIAPGGRLPPKNSNTENAELYPVHPYRLYGVGLPNLTLARSTFVHRRFPCNDGWCQDVIDAALLNMTHEAAAMVEDRITENMAPARFRFPGFAADFQDDAPSLDHFATMTTAVNYMLLSPYTVGENGGILAFPGFPADLWNVEFKLCGPNNTVMEASCQGGNLTYWHVHPHEMSGRIRHMGSCPLVATSMGEALQATSARK